MASKEIKTLRDFPAVEELLQTQELSGTVNGMPRPLAAEIIRNVIGGFKSQLKYRRKSIKHSILIDAIGLALSQWRDKEIRRVINATGIIVHTNLGRAPLGRELIEEISDCISGYNNLEFDLSTGKRGDRGEACEKYLALLTGAESATIVNNCAAALFIILNTFAIRRKVLLSRGELVQIGGGFRIPDILKRSGAKLEEVGTTNITNLKDYAESVEPGTSMILKVHKSNFVQAGFTKEVPLSGLVPLARKNKLILVHDLGSGALISAKKTIGFDEPTPMQSIRDGADIVCFSGDKLLGGVQAGLIAGKKELIEKIKQNPLFRTVRVDKFVITALEKIFKSYLAGKHETDIKLWQLLTISEGDLYKRARSICLSLGNPELISVEATKSFIGGGGLPESALESVGLIFSKEYHAGQMLTLFRKCDPPIIGRIENDRLILDLKAITIAELKVLENSIKQVLKQLAK